VVVFFILGAWVSAVLPVVRRSLASQKRQEAQVRTAAAAAFYEERVWTTHAHTGLLLYVSLLERQVIVLADQGVTAAVPSPAWNRSVTTLRQDAQAADPPASLLTGLQELGKVLATALHDAGPAEVTIASAIGPARSASRLSRWRSTGVKPLGAKDWLASCLALAVGSAFIRRDDTAQT